MANDREVLREVWEGKVPVCFRLDPAESTDLRQPEPFYLMVPRLSYFPLVTDKVRKHFQPRVPAAAPAAAAGSDRPERDMWLEYGGQPLRWHLPIGVLCDLMLDGDHDQLPWAITVHFDNFPEAQVYRFSSRETVEAYFMACVKEADVLKHRGQVVSGMQKKDHNQLWLGLQNDKFDQFWAVNRKLMEPGSNQEHFKYIPYRCYINDTYKQKLVKPVDDDGRHKTLSDLISETFPGSTVKVKTHGMEPPLETPLQWLSEHLSYPDNFLHLCVQV